MGASKKWRAFASTDEFLSQTPSLPHCGQTSTVSVAAPSTNGRNGSYSGKKMVSVRASNEQLLAFEYELDKLVLQVDNDDEREQFKREMDSFKNLYVRWRESGKDGTEPLDWRKIGTPGVIPYDAISGQCSKPFGITEYDESSGSTNGFTKDSELVMDPETVERVRQEDRKLLDKLVVVKLNGGLGTTMGCVGPKSAIEVRTDLTFLDLTVRQIQGLNRYFGTNVPLVLMNSFNTDDETAKMIQRYKRGVQIRTFRQKRFPRIMKDSHMPLPETPWDPSTCWYPPGHGDVFDSFCKSDTFQALRDAGKEYVFISNIDNLGATVDLNIARYLASNPECEFLMEVTDRLRSDVKGGTLIDYEGRLRLLELAQVPHSKRDDFSSIKKFTIFNTNNLWVRLDALQQRVEELNLDIIVNPKTTADGANVLQLETAAGAAVLHFKNPVAVNVPRCRFLPVKNTSDLFVVQSNLYSLEHNCLRLSPKRVQLAGPASIPVVKLGEHFHTVRDYMERFQTIPDILELDHLTVSGDVTFGANVNLKGTVIVVANHGDRIDIPSGSVLENKVVTGNLRILDH